MKNILIALITLFIINGCSDHKHTHWGYEGENGPEH
jgi:carbonic anhydrase